jgi:hypothetical protein
LAKNSFQLHGVDEKGNRMLKKKLIRKQLVAFIAQLPPCLIEKKQGQKNRVRPQKNIIEKKQGQTPKK